MAEYEYFPTFVTKGITVEKREDERRIFKGHITAEIVDRQQEFIFVKEVMEIMEEFMKISPNLSEVHTNRMVGKVLSYEKSSINGVASVLITGEVHKSSKFKLYDKVWEKIVKGEYRGLSMGGASKERELIEKDGKTALELRKLELYEIAICPSPANAFAIIEHVNTFAKANNIGQDRIQDLDGRCIIKCDQLGMCFEKGTEMNVDVDLDNHQYKCDGKTNICDDCGKTKEEHGLEQFDKPTEKKQKETLTGESASTRADNIGQATFSPKETKDVITSIKVPTAPKITAPQVKMAKAMNVYEYIDHFGEEIVKQALEEKAVVKYLKGLTKKYL